jgi:hypothetical protein
VHGRQPDIRSNHAETPQQSASCCPQKSASFSASKIHAETSRFWHGTTVLSACRIPERMMGKEKRAAIYLRVSTGEQTVDNQRRELEAAAASRGWSVVAVYADEGISGAKGLEGRPQLDLMLKDAVRRRFDVAMVWAVDRLGRSLADLIGSMQELHMAGNLLFGDPLAQRGNRFLHRQRALVRIGVRGSGGVLADWAPSDPLTSRSPIDPKRALMIASICVTGPDL